MTDDPRLKSSEPKPHPTAELKNCKLGRHVAIGERCVLREVTIGDFSYFERHAEAIYASVGKFCSIAANTRINALEHPIERVTQHKISYRPNEYFRYLGVDEAFRKRRQGRHVSVGNDVWIGHGGVVMPGVTIGNGAVVGANAVVTKDVAAYTIVAGNPAKVLRRRFSEAVAERIEKLAWWNWPEDRLFNAIHDMQALDIEAWLDKWEKA